MNNKTNTEAESFEQAHVIQMKSLVPETTDLVFKDYSEMLPKAICIKYHDSTVTFGLMLAETSDSFLVGAGTALVSEEDGAFSAVPVSPIGVVRVFKSNIKQLSEVAAKFRFWYYKYLIAKNGGQKVLPSIIKGIVLDEILAYTKESESDYISANNQDETLDSTKETVAEKYAKKGIMGVSKYAFEASIPSTTLN